MHIGELVGKRVLLKIGNAGFGRNAEITECGSLKLEKGLAQRCQQCLDAQIKEIKE